MNTVQASSFGKALYYPYIQIHDENWLKLALLYFDGIRRIVPKYVDPDDSPIEREVVNRGLLEATSPEDYCEAAEEKFVEDFLPLLEQKTSEATLLLKQVSQTFSKNRVSTRLLHLEKMTNSLRWKLEDLGLARKDGDWLRVDSNVAGSYMICLAAVMSSEIKAPPVTDTPEYQSLGEYLSFGQIPEGRFQEPHSILLKLSVNFPDPQSLENVPISRILRFSEHHRDERKQFRQVIESITKAANETSDPIALEDSLNEKRRDIESALRDHQRALDELNVKFVGSLLSVSAPTAIAATAGLAVPPLAAVLTGVGISVSLVKWWAEVRGSRREAVKKSPWHYLLSVQQFTPKTSLGASLWGIRQKAISAGESLLTMSEIEQEVLERRGGYRES
ncbi:DUF6236 family protein [Kovacikia minuta CCNUW1]|uniref:DUF6236 family protein n=1 Tax=Kovacikia minuta TaxID=2931930 RepID=UPI001CCD848A|nr:DUF6236 family protein [Kovacikia minuta]UBF26646.1 DUF6236 family protein [Kovacikia minuta CCNUW1]